MMNFLSLWRTHQLREAVVQRCYVKKGVLINFAKLTGKHLHRCFHVKLEKLLRTLSFIEYLAVGCFSIEMLLESLHSLQRFVQSQKWKHKSNVGNLFKVNYEGTK